MPFAATWMDLGVIILSEVRERQIPHDITHMWNLFFKKIQMNLFTKTDLQILKTNLWLPKGKGGGGGINQELGINTHTLPCIR